MVPASATSKGDPGGVPPWERGGPAAERHRTATQPPTDRRRPTGQRSRQGRRAAPHPRNEERGRTEAGKRGFGGANEARRGAVRGRERCTTLNHMNRHEYIVTGRDTVPGWFLRTDAELFDAIDVAQRQAGITGDLLEIGCYQGASAVLLGFMRNPGERFIVCDIFDGDTLSPENETERERFYTDLSRQSFKTNYLRFHDELPEIVAGPSAALFDEGLERSFRFIHVDGSHAYDVVRSDLLLCKRLLTPGGVVVFDDIVTMHAPGVPAAVWEGVLSDELVPLFQSRKFYGTWGTPLHVDIPKEFRSDSHDVLGHMMLHIEDVPIDSVAPMSINEDDLDTQYGEGEQLLVSEKERQLLLMKRRVMTDLRQNSTKIVSAFRHRSRDKRPWPRRD